MLTEHDDMSRSTPDSIQSDIITGLDTAGLIGKGKDSGQNASEAGARAGSRISGAQANQDIRVEFLRDMYKVMWDNIGRHILVVWQSLAALIAAFGVLFLSDKKVLNPDLATSIIVLTASWAAAHSLDAAGWYNRNLLIVTNIERQFLTLRDKSEIHPFFDKPKHHTVIEHLKIQLVFVGGIAALTLYTHFVDRVGPTLGKGGRFSFSLAAPYFISVVCSVCIGLFARKTARAQTKLMTESPGKPTLEK